MRYRAKKTLEAWLKSSMSVTTLSPRIARWRNVEKRLLKVVVNGDGCGGILYRASLFWVVSTGETACELCIWVRA